MSQFQQGSSKSVAVRCAKKEEVLLVQKEESIMICHVRSPYRDNEECLDSILFNHLIGIPIIVSVMPLGSSWPVRCHSTALRAKMETSMMMMMIRIHGLGVDA